MVSKITTKAVITTDRPAMHARRAGLRRSRWAAALLIAACGALGAARAGVLVEGTPAAVRVTADHAAISDVLAAVAGNFNAKYRSAVVLDAPANPAYAGSFAQVIARLLDGYNYVVKKHGETTEITVFGRRGEVAIPPRAPKPAPPAGFLSRWR
jgi:hypothetical protein